MPPPTRARTVHVEHCMGTVFTIDVRDPGDWSCAIADVVRWLHLVDQVFSTYRHESDISRLQRGELQMPEAHPDVAVVLGICDQIADVSRGWFSATPHGRLDPTGLVKGWAIERASELLRAHGATDSAVNGGGDMQLAGEATPGRAWTVGISDPRERRRILATVRGRDLAIATSGNGERGEHIVDPSTGAASSKLGSVTVAGPSLTYADAYATAAFAMGSDALAWIDSLDGFEALVVGLDGRVTRTADFPGSPVTTS